MALPASLIDEFVTAIKSTNADNAKSETTLNGTVKIIDGVTHVSLDGSDIDTPVNSLVAVSNGDRVKVRMSGHQATITGNMSDVSIGQATSGMGEMQTYVRIHDGTIELGKAGNNMIAVLTNNELSFTDRANKVAYINDKTMHITRAEVTEQFKINNWVWRQRSNGNLTLTYGSG